ncbi:MAG: hypothetical protein ACK4UN_13000, partial [Limisphaerales bacterium]
RDRVSRYTYESLSWGPALRIGLVNRVDFKVEAARFEDRYKFESGWAGDRVYRTGSWGPAFFSLKANLVGNDGGPFALSIEPFYGTPIDWGGDFYGVNVPMTFNLTSTTKLTLMPRFEVEDANFYEIKTFLGTAELRQSIWNRFDVLGRVATTVSEAEGRVRRVDTDWQVYLGAGVAYRITDNIEIQSGCDFGVTRWTEDLIWGTVLSVRF